jgi:hypothetical protein
MIDTRNMEATFAEYMSEIRLQHIRPSVLHRPKVYIDGNRWCALYGENLQDGVAGFGDSPSNAMYDFDAQWNKPLPARTAKVR